MCAYAQLIPLEYFNLCVFEEGNITTVYCHVKSNKVWKTPSVSASFLMCPLFLLFVFLGSSFCTVKKTKEGEGPKSHIFCGLISLFVDSACRNTQLTAMKSTIPSVFTYFWDPDLNHLGLFGMVCSVCAPRRVLAPPGC